MSNFFYTFHPFIFLFIYFQLDQLAYLFNYLLMNSLQVNIFVIINYNLYKYCIAVAIY